VAVEKSKDGVEVEEKIDLVLMKEEKENTTDLMEQEEGT